MALKVWLNGSMKKIDTNLHKPVTFINGTKYKLDKAWTFVNGVKQQIWGESGVQIDYIKSEGVLGGGLIFAIGENWALGHYSRNVYKIDISNLDSPTLIQGPVAWGSVNQYSSIQSSGSNNVYVGDKLNENTIIKLNVTSTGVITATGTYSAGGTSFMGFVSNSVLSKKNLTQIINPRTSISSGYISIHYGTQFYYGATAAYSTGTYSTGNTSFFYASDWVEYDANTVLVSMAAYQSSQQGWYKATSTGLTQVQQTNALLTASFVDGNVICRGAGAVFSLLDKTSLTNLYSWTAPEEWTGRNVRFLGRNGDYYYLIAMPANNQTGDYRLVLLNKNNLTMEYNTLLPEDPFNDASSGGSQIVVTNDTTGSGFWRNGTIVPQISNTGFLCISSYTSSSLLLKIVRFSSIF